ncbi:MAG TPA: pyridoxamine 5'-phosphate oxidase [Thermodesulfobacteriota bacterium]|nr:pyridoxamine 5'-phosphate oxidase [Thermodesulfobacteriota bacterium]
METDVSGIGKQYGLLELNESDLDPNPFKQFEKWFEDALKADLIHPNAMTVATATKDGKPSARMMLLKGFDEDGFVFYTNSESKKGEDLAENPQAALVFWWDKLERQVRIEGHTEKVSDEKADSYFKSRPKGSQLGAWASEQSHVISSREVLEQRLQELEIKYQNREIPRPHYWTGYKLRVSSIEFWQGRPNRLHDRLRFRLRDNGSWIIERLSP